MIDLKAGDVFDFSNQPSTSVGPYLVLETDKRRGLLVWWAGREPCPAPIGYWWRPNASDSSLVIAPHSSETLVEWVRHLNRQKETTDDA